jgi:hypothetical protein
MSGGDLRLPARTVFPRDAYDSLFLAQLDDGSQ